MIYTRGWANVHPFKVKQLFSSGPSFDVNAEIKPGGDSTKTFLY